MTGKDGGFLIREAREEDVLEILDIVNTIYGKGYPVTGFFDPQWLKRAIFSDDNLMLVAVDEDDGRVLGTASLVLDVGAHSDLVGEMGRLAVRKEARERGIGNALMERRVEYIRKRLHVGVVENRCAHPFSQRISEKHGFAAVGFLPQKHLFAERESIALFAQHFGNALALRKNNPRIVPEAHPLASMALSNCGLPMDAILDEDSAAYPRDREFEIEELTAEGLPTLMRIERGRVRNREIFGPMRLHYGFFMLEARRANYLIARRPSAGSGPAPIGGAIGFIRDDDEKVVKVFELIAQTDHAVPILISELLRRCRHEWGIQYVDVDVSAHAPRMQRTLIEHGLVPAAYVPAMVFHEVERLDVIKMIGVIGPPDLGHTKLVPSMQSIADLVMRSYRRQAVLPAVSEAVNRMHLFRGLNTEQRRRVARMCGVTSVKKGELLFAEGETAEAMYIVIDGTVCITAGDPPRRLGCVEPGASVGEVALITDEPHSANATADEVVRLAVLSSKALEELTRQRPDIAVVLYRNMADGLGRKLRGLDESLVHGF